MMNTYKDIKFSPVQIFIFLVVALVSVGNSAQTNHDVSAEMIESWMTELSNWGRWGDDDQFGALNLITPEKIIAAAKLVQSGVSVSLAHNYSVVSGQAALPAFDRQMTTIDVPGEFAMERISFSYHGSAHPSNWRYRLADESNRYFLAMESALHRSASATTISEQLEFG